MDQHAKTVRNSVIAWIDRILRKQNWTGTELARQAGIAPSTILRLLNDPAHSFVPSMKTLGRLAAASGAPIPRDVLDTIGTKGALLTDRRMGPPGTDGERGGRTIKLKHLSALPVSLRSAAHQTERVRVPVQLRTDPTLVAFRMFNDDLAPLIKSGTLLFATRRRDPVKGDIVLFSSKAGPSKVRFLFDMDESGLKFSRSLPMTPEEQVPFDEIGELAIMVAMIVEP
jgi:transcriptional regulator with XRE-family HTH domain